MDGWMHGCMDRQMDLYNNIHIHGIYTIYAQYTCTDNIQYRHKVYMHGLTDGHGCTDGGTNGCVYSMYIYNSIPIIHTALQIRTGQWSITAKLWLLASHIYNVLIIVTSSFSKKSFSIIFRSSRTQVFFKTGVIRNFAIFKENISFGVSFQ